MSEATLSHRKVIDYSEKHDHNEQNFETDFDAGNSGDHESPSPPSSGLITKVGQGIWSGTTGVVGFTCGTLYSAACKSANAGATVAGYLPGAGWFRRSANDTKDSVNPDSTTDDKSEAPEEKPTNSNLTTAVHPKSKSWLSRGKDKDD